MGTQYITRHGTGGIALELNTQNWSKIMSKLPHLGGGPLDRELGALARSVLVLALDDAGQTKIGDLADVVLADQDVSCGKISVDVVLCLEVRHPGRDLRRHVDQLWELERAPLERKNGGRTTTKTRSAEKLG